MLSTAVPLTRTALLQLQVAFCTSSASHFSGFELDKPVAFEFDRVLSIMAAAALAVVPRSLRYDERYLNCIAQAYQTIAQLCFPVEGFDLVP